MIIRPVSLEEKARFNAAATHPLQSWEWGDFRQAQGQKVERLGVFTGNGDLKEAIQVTFHSIPYIGGAAGYFPKGAAPTVDTLEALKELGRRNNALFIKLEPNLAAPVAQEQPFFELEKTLEASGAVLGRPLFTRYTFTLDLTPTEEQLLENCKSKTRYNIRLAEKKGVQIVEDTSEQGLEDYLTLLKETTTRQGFYAHDDKYFRTMWQTIGQSGMIRILKAKYEDKVLSAWVLFMFNGVGYYPYGASSREHREVMANNLLMWEALKLAKREGCTSFDMWGALGPEPDPKHKWYGFHKFKEGYGAILQQTLPTYDLVVSSSMYKIFTMGDSLRWRILRLRAKLGR